MKKYKCKVCGYIHEGELPADFVCPKCKKPASYFEEIVETAETKNIYAGTKTGKNLLDAFAGESQALSGGSRAAEDHTSGTTPSYQPREPHDRITRKNSRQTPERRQSAPYSTSDRN